MGTGIDLLRLLEPAVRPGNVAGPARAGEQPIEAKSFDDLLAEAQAAGGSGEESTEGGDKAGAKPGIDPLRELAQVSRIENAAVLKKWKQI